MVKQRGNAVTVARCTGYDVDQMTRWDTLLLTMLYDWHSKDSDMMMYRGRLCRGHSVLYMVFDKLHEYSR